LIFNKHRSPEINVDGKSFKILSYLISDTTFLKLSSPTSEADFLTDITPTNGFLSRLKKYQIDIFSFWQRNWVHKNLLSYPYKKVQDNVAILEIFSYDYWWTHQIDKKTRNMVRKSVKEGVNVRLCEFSDRLAEDICKIYNETPIRQNRLFRHYGENVAELKERLQSLLDKSCFLGAYLQDELIGFIQLTFGENFAMITQILSMQRYWWASPNNALISKAVEICVYNKKRYLIYYKMEDDTTLDIFKKNNGFRRWIVPRYYIPLSKRGKVILAAQVIFSARKKMVNKIPKYRIRM